VELTGANNALVSGSLTTEWHKSRSDS
jgi:hypothetical protein